MPVVRLSHYAGAIRNRPLVASGDLSLGRGRLIALTVLAAIVAVGTLSYVIANDTSWLTVLVGVALYLLSRPHIQMSNGDRDLYLSFGDVAAAPIIVALASADAIAAILVCAVLRTLSPVLQTDWSGVAANLLGDLAAAAAAIALIGYLDQFSLSSAVLGLAAFAVLLSVGNIMVVATGLVFYGEFAPREFVRESGLDVEVLLMMPLAVLTTVAVVEISPLVVFLLVPIVHVIARLGNARERLKIAEVDARTDGLTQLANRRALESDATHLFAEALVSGGSFVAFVLDIDHFKQVNDTFGHDVGDEVLRLVASALADFDSAAMPGLTPYRAGGEEFVLLVSGEYSQREVRDVGEAILAAVRQCEGPRPTTASLGAAQHVALPGSVSEAHVDIEAALAWNDLLRRADQSLYDAKHSGRDCLRIAAA